mmetsp:Transcript_25798/g.60486  ORF Transcript_25798/g.60486 Transcript_25798/m.60486 type:complete len:144 (+) Transcript_25798:157-588(+)
MSTVMLMRHRLIHRYHVSEIQDSFNDQKRDSLCRPSAIDCGWNHAIAVCYPLFFQQRRNSDKISWMGHHTQNVSAKATNRSSPAEISSESVATSRLTHSSSVSFGRMESARAYFFGLALSNREIQLSRLYEMATATETPATSF